MDCGLRIKDSLVFHSALSTQHYFIMDCRTAHYMLEQDAAGQLSPIDAKALQTHMEQCAACSREAAFMNRIDSALGALEPVAAPAGLRRRVYAALEPLMEKSSFPWRRWLYHLALAPTFAIALWLMFVVDSTWAIWFEGIKSTKDMDLATIMHVGMALIERTSSITLAIFFGSIILLLVYLREAFFTK